MDNDDPEIEIRKLKEEVHRLREWLHLAPTIIGQKVLTLEELKLKALQTDEHPSSYDPFQTSYGTDGIDNSFWKLTSKKKDDSYVHALLGSNLGKTTRT